MPQSKHQIDHDKDKRYPEKDESDSDTGLDSMEYICIRFSLMLCVNVSFHSWPSLFARLIQISCCWPGLFVAINTHTINSQSSFAYLKPVLTAHIVRAGNPFLNDICHIASDTRKVGIDASSLDQHRSNKQPESDYNRSIMDDIFDILGISMFATSGVWCTLKNMPCIPFPSCEEHMEDEKCKYESDN
ncbi:MAG: hypothetical protein A4E65_02814 [Syntrophorhabdus sp. PtaU1.Bin153]|nr:MAG: hypothetical protein A4E65_02814 [Syntrophorhabdus sp. PtaU1.Bin153]